MGNPYQELHAPDPNAAPDDAPEGHAFDLDPIPVKVHGRGLMIGQATVEENGACTIRLDDNLRPMFWAEIHLDFAFVNRWFAQVQERKRARPGRLVDGEGI